VRDKLFDYYFKKAAYFLASPIQSRPAWLNTMEYPVSCRRM